MVFGGMAEDNAGAVAPTVEGSGDPVETAAAQQQQQQQQPQSGGGGGGGGRSPAVLRKAGNVEEFKGAGQKAGLEIWRVDVGASPDVVVRRWPREDYGAFFTSDAYLVLNAFRAKDESGRDADKLAHDLHLWLGSDTLLTPDALLAFAAPQELVEVLGKVPVLHRELRNHESALFQSYFKAIQYCDGPIAAGFRFVKPEEYKPRLFQVRRTRKAVRAWEVPVNVSSLNKGDVFILDAGLSIYTVVGEESNAFERMKGGALAHNLVAARQGKSKAKAELDDEFWRLLNGSPSDVRPPEERTEDAEDKPVETDKLRLYKVDGPASFSLTAEGKLNTSMLSSSATYIVDAGIEILVWVGRDAAASSEQIQGLSRAAEFLAAFSKPSFTPVTVVAQGQSSVVFSALVRPG